MQQPDGTEQHAAALEIIRREALRSGRPVRALVDPIERPPTQPEQLLLAAVRLLRSPQAIMPQPCATMAEWRDATRRTQSRDATQRATAGHGCAFRRQPRGQLVRAEFEP
jgi:hypothetical protein